MSDVITINKHIDLVYSPDDGGWYFQNYLDNTTSQLFDNESEARDALHDAACDGNVNRSIEWE